MFVDMALLAQEGWPCLQHRRIGRSVGQVTDAAIVLNRCMLPQQGTALFGVAGVAGSIHSALDQQLRTGRTMCVVTIGASHLAFSDRMPRHACELGTLFLVAGKADLGLRRLAANLVLCRVYLVA